MNAGSLTKAQRREVRRLAGSAYKRELSAAAAALEEKFNRWRRGELDVFALNEQIHKYHDGVSRDLYQRYVLGEPQWAVADAVRRGILQEQEVVPEIMSCLGGLIEFFKTTEAGE
jgi:hypothetical protein